MRLALAFLLLASLAAADATEPKLSDATHAKIRDLQYAEAEIQLQFRNTQDALNAQIDAAYTEAGVKREDWTLDLNTLRFTKVEKKPEVKKP